AEAAQLLPQVGQQLFALASRQMQIVEEQHDGWPCRGMGRQVERDLAVQTVARALPGFTSLWRRGVDRDAEAGQGLQERRQRRRRLLAVRPGVRLGAAAADARAVQGGEEPELAQQAALRSEERR